jgi:hypothetical protein
VNSDKIPLEVEIRDLEKLLVDEERREAVCIGVLNAAEEQFVTAMERLAAARRDEGEHTAALEAARSAYADEPTDANAKKLAKSREKLELATLRVKRPNETVDTAEAAVTSARAAVDDCDRELARLDEALAVARLRLSISLEAWKEQSLPLYDAVIETDRAAKAAKKALFDAFETNRQGSETLRAKGLDVPEATPLGAVHLVSAAALVRADMDPSISLGLVERLVDATGMMGVDLTVAIEHIAAAASPSATDVRHLLQELLSQRAPSPFHGSKLVERERQKQGQAAHSALALAAKTKELAEEQAGLVFIEKARMAQARKNAEERIRKERDEADRKAELAREQAEFAQLEREAEDELRGAS